jgi:hypothetical protein
MYHFDPDDFYDWVKHPKPQASIGVTRRAGMY